MNTTIENELIDQGGEGREIIAEALAIIDRGLAQLLHRDLVSTTEAADLLLDVRSLLTGVDDEPAAN